MLRSLFIPVILLTSTLAQENPRCRCCNLSRVHPEYLKHLPPPSFRKNIGKSHLKVTTSSPEAQRWFDQGLAHLHGFWEFEAYRSFLQALRHDPDCAMAYWGICMALPGKDNEAAAERKAALAIAQELSEKISPHEKAYLKLVGKLIQSGPTSALNELDEIISAHPDDYNAIAWRGLWANKGYQSGKPKPETKKAIESLQAALKKAPDNVALNHYLIHILETGPDFEQARDAAKSLAKVATDSGHLTHMPGHIHYLAGEYEKACEAFLKCDQTETTYLKKEKIPDIDHKNYLHNLHYLIYAASDHGNYQLANQTAKRLAKITVPENRLKADGSQINRYTAPMAQAIPHIRARQFNKAAETLDENSIPKSSHARHFIRFLKSNCLLKGLIFRDGPLSDEEFATVRKLAFQQSKDAKLLKAASPSFFAETQPLALAKKTVAILKAETKALLDLAQLKKEDDLKLAWALMTLDLDVDYTEPPLLVTPAAETLGWAALSKSHPAQAIDFFTQALERRKQSGQIYQGLAIASKMMVKESEAKNYTKLANAALFKDH